MNLLVVMIIKKEISTLIMIVSNPICHDTLPLFLSMSSIVPTWAVIFLLYLLQCFVGVEKLLSIKFRKLGVHGHVGLLKAGIH